MPTAPIFAADFRAIGLTVAALVLSAFVALIIRNISRAKPELGSEIELAPNRKPYLSDEELEGPKLDRSLTFALAMLAILAVALPFYWLAEPGRQDGAIDAYNLSFEVQGEDLYTTGAQCVNCHAAGGVGGTAAYVLQDANGQFVANASWQAPALNNVLLRYSEDEVRQVLNFGRPGTPMAAWGTPGGGPLTTQQVDNLIAYLRTLQVQSLDPLAISEAGTEEEIELAQAAADELEAEIRTEIDRSIEAGEFETVGEAVFNLGLYSGFQGGSLSCARCHTAGWSLGATTSPDVLDEGVEGCGGGDPSGIGFNLCGDGLGNRFPGDSWKGADGSWMPPEGLDDDDGFYIEAADGSKIRLDESGNPVTDDGRPYLILDEKADTDPLAAATDETEGATDEADDAATEATDDEAPADAGSDPASRAGDLADCAYVSQLYQPETGAAYPFPADHAITFDEDTGAEVPPPVLEPAEVPGGEVIMLADSSLAGECTIVEMPERTSQAHYDFVHDGAEAGIGYGLGGQSQGGMMPGFGGILPPDLIQAVVDYERGL